MQGGQTFLYADRFEDFFGPLGHIFVQKYKFSVKCKDCVEKLHSGPDKGARRAGFDPRTVVCKPLQVQGPNSL